MANTLVYVRDAKTGQLIPISILSSNSILNIRDCKTSKFVSSPVASNGDGTYNVNIISLLNLDLGEVNEP